MMPPLYFIYPHIYYSTKDSDFLFFLKIFQKVVLNFMTDKQKSDIMDMPNKNCRKEVSLIS